MNYNATSHIESVQDVKVFFHHLAFDRKLSFHPDDDFADYVNLSDGTPAFNEQEVFLYNRLMDECFTMCNHVDVNELGVMEIMQFMDGKIS